MSGASSGKTRVPLGWNQWRFLHLHVWCLKWDDSKSGQRWDFQGKCLHEGWASTEHGSIMVLLLAWWFRAPRVNVSANKAFYDLIVKATKCHFCCIPVVEAFQAHLDSGRVDVDITF